MIVRLPTESPSNVKIGSQLRVQKFVHKNVTYAEPDDFLMFGFDLWVCMWFVILFKGKYVDWNIILFLWLFVNLFLLDSSPIIGYPCH